MARLRISLNEGSLLRRTVLHVGVFVLGTAAFLALASFLLVTLMKGVLPSEQGASQASSEGDGDEAAATAKPGAAKLKGPRKKRSPAAAVAPQPAAEEE